MDCTVMSLVLSTTDSFKPGILKNERNIAVTFDFLALQEGPHGWGQSGSDSVV